MPGNNVIAVAVAAARPACFNPPAQTTPCLVGKVLEVKGIHGSFETNLEIGNLTLTQSKELDAGEAQPLVESCDIRLIARQAIERFRNDEIDPTGHAIFHQGLDAGPQEGRPTDRSIGVGLDRMQTLVVQPIAAEPHLILNGGIALVVTGITGVYCSAHGLAPSQTA